MTLAWKNREVAHIFLSIRKYTKFVDLSKLALALMAIAVVVLIIVIPLMNSGDNATRLVFTSIEKTTIADKPKMLHLRYQGMDNKNQPYNVTADAGWQISDDLIQLQKPNADILLKDGRWVALTANEGTMNSKQKWIDAKGSVDVFYDQGYEFTTEFMHLDMDAKKITSDLLVKGHGSAGTLEAKGGFVATQADGRIFFKGPVHTVIYAHGGKG